MTSAPSIAGNNLAEFEVLRFLFDNKAYQSVFSELSDEACFKEAQGLQKILRGAGIEDAFVRELIESGAGLENEGDFLHSLCKINLAFLNRVKKLGTLLALKKQIFVLLDRNATRLRKTLSNDEFNALFLQTLKTLKHSKDENELAQILQNFQKNEFIIEVF